MHTHTLTTTTSNTHTGTHQPSPHPPTHSHACVRAHAHTTQVEALTDAIGAPPVPPAALLRRPSSAPSRASAEAHKTSSTPQPPPDCRPSVESGQEALPLVDSGYGLDDQLPSRGPTSTAALLLGQGLGAELVLHAHAHPLQRTYANRNLWIVAWM